jgi:Fanconi anemia group M protein
MVEIYADMRESRSGVIKALQEMENVNVKVGSLPCGDYILSPQVAVERKAATDFVISIMEGRIFQQVAKMKLDYERPIVLIEGDVFKTRSAIDRKSIAGAISWINAIEQVSVLMVSEESETPIMLATMARHLQEGLGYEINLHPKKPKPNKDAAQYVIGSLPGIGPGNSRKLFQHFGSIFKTVNATPEMIAHVKGIGPKIATRIHELIHFENAE